MCILLLPVDILVDIDDVPDREQLLPVALRIVEHLELGREDFVPLQNETDHVAKIAVIFGGSLFKSEMLHTAKIHNFDLAVKGNANVVHADVAMHDSIIVQLGIDLQEFLDVRL